MHCIGFPKCLSGKKFSCQCRRCKRCGFDPKVGKILWRRKWQPAPLFLPRKFRGQRSLATIVHGVTKNQTGLSNWAWTQKAHNPVSSTTGNKQQSLSFSPLGACWIYHLACTEDSSCARLYAGLSGNIKKFLIKKNTGGFQRNLRLKRRDSNI